MAPWKPTIALRQIRGDYMFSFFPLRYNYYPIIIAQSFKVKVDHFPYSFSICETKKTNKNEINPPVIDTGVIDITVSG